VHGIRAGEELAHLHIQRTTSSTRQCCRGCALARACRTRAQPGVYARPVPAVAARASLTMSHSSSE
jgi:hypothetical protein